MLRHKLGWVGMRDVGIRDERVRNTPVAFLARALCGKNSYAAL